jgi:Ca-activated chloride channel family protein
MTTTFFGITWTTSSLIYLPLLAVFCALVFLKLVRSQKFFAVLAHAKWRHYLLKRYSFFRLLLKTVLLCLGATGLFLALLHPSWGKKEEIVSQQGRDLFIALDISRSMLAQDKKPNRLSYAKEKIKTLVHKLSSERVGLALFAGSSFIQCPLTSDYAAFFMFLEAVDAETVSSGTTALDQIIYKVLQLFKGMPAKKNKLLVIFTDGEDFSSNLANVKQKAHDMGLHIFTIGIGTQQGAPVPIIDDHGNQRGVEKDAKGGVIISRLNEGILKTLAHDTGGTYVNSTNDDKDVTRLVQLVESYEKEQLEDKKVSQVEEQYPYFLAGSFFCFVLEWLL